MYRVLIMLMLILNFIFNIYSDNEKLMKRNIWEYEARYTDKLFKLTPEEAERVIKDITKQVYDCISKKDFKKLSEYVHPLNGCRISPALWINSKNIYNVNGYIVGEPDRILSKKEIECFFEDKNKYYYGCGFRFSNKKDCIYSNDDYYSIKIFNQDPKLLSIKYNHTMNRPFLISNWFEIYNSPIMVEYIYDSFKTLRLFYEIFNNEWVLVGICSDTDDFFNYNSQNFDISLNYYISTDFLSPEQAFSAINKTSKNAIDAFVKMDMKKFAELVDPQKGLVISNTPYIANIKKVFSQKIVSSLDKDNNKYSFSFYDDEGKLTFKEMFNKFTENYDFSKAPVVSYNRIHKKSQEIRNWQKRFDKFLFVEYLYPFKNDDSYTSVNSYTSWRSLTMIFESNKDGKWYIVALCFDGSFNNI